MKENKDSLRPGKEKECIEIPTTSGCGRHLTTTDQTRGNTGFDHEITQQISEDAKQIHCNQL